MTLAFTHDNLPSRKLESYKYTNLSGLLKNFLEPIASPSFPTILNDRDACVITTQDRHLSCAVSTRAEIVMIDDLPPSDTPSWTSRTINVTVEPNAHLTFIRMLPSNGAVTDQINITLKAHAQLTVIHLHAGNAIARTNLAITLDEQASAHITALNILPPTGHGDFTTFMQHRGIASQSIQNIRNIVSGSSRAVYQGKVYVAQTAQKTDARQSCKSILLSNAAEVDAKPELEIYADDVQCSHGASAGTVDQDALFYAAARGIPADMAQQMLIRSFVLTDLPNNLPSDVMEKILSRIDRALVKVTK